MRQRALNSSHNRWCRDGKYQDNGYGSASKHASLCSKWWWKPIYNSCCDSDEFWAYDAAVYVSLNDVHSSLDALRLFILIQILYVSCVYACARLSPFTRCLHTGFNGIAIWKKQKITEMLHCNYETSGFSLSFFLLPRIRRTLSIWKCVRYENRI